MILVKKNGIAYSIVSPVRNEVGTIKQTLESVISQTIRPAKWVIVDDGSTDGTSQVLASYAARHGWIGIMSYDDKGCLDYESAHGKLRQGLAEILSYRNDYIVKMDADITFGSTYFEDIFRRFDADPRLGIAGGWFHVDEGDGWVPERHPVYHVRGGSKIYRWQCWEDIGGFIPKLGYDMIDEIQAHMNGWTTKSFEDIEVRHHRKTGGSKGPVGWSAYAGKLNYLVWYHPLYVFFKGLRIAITERPYVIKGIALIYGFLRCYWQRQPRSIHDPEFIRFIRSQQIRKLTFRHTVWK